MRQADTHTGRKADRLKGSKQYRKILRQLDNHLSQCLPPLAQKLGDLSVVQLRRLLDDLVALNLAPHHERVHWPLDVVRGRLLGLRIS